MKEIQQKRKERDLGEEVVEEEIVQAGDI